MINFKTLVEQELDEILATLAVGAAVGAAIAKRRAVGRGAKAVAGAAGRTVAAGARVAGKVAGSVVKGGARQVRTRHQERQSSNTEVRGVKRELNTQDRIRATKKGHNVIKHAGKKHSDQQED